MTGANESFYVVGAIPTAPEPPCFAYLVFKSQESGKSRFLQVVQRGKIVGFQKVAQSNVIRLKRQVTAQVGGRALFCFKSSKGRYYIAPLSAMQDHIRSILASNQLDNFPVFKRSLYQFIGDENKLEQANCEIINRYKKPRPEFTKYFVMNDVLRNHISHQISPEVRNVLSNTRISHSGASITLDYPPQTSLEAKQSIDLALKSTVERSQAVGNYTTVANDEKTAKTAKPVSYGDFDFDFPFSEEFISKISKEHCFLVLDFSDRPQGKRRNVFQSLPFLLRSSWNRGGGPIHIAVDLVSAQTVRTRTQMVFRHRLAHTIFVAYFSINPNVASFLEEPPTLRKKEVLKLAMSYALPIRTIISILRDNLPKGEHARCHRFIEVGVNPPPRDLHTGSYFKMFTAAPVLDSALTSVIKRALRI